MRGLVVVCFVCGILLGCDQSRVYEQNADFPERYWTVNEKPEFEFTIEQPADTYTLYGNIRNSVSYPYARIFFNYYLQDSTGADIETKLESQYLFDAKTGKPFGNSGLGDIYDHSFPLLTNYQFKHRGRYKIKLEQLMRVDTLKGILAVGVRIEKSVLE